MPGPEPPAAIPAPKLVALLVLVVLALAGTAGPAEAVGAQGVDLAPLLDRSGGTLTATVQADTTIRLRLANTTDEPRTVAVHAAEAIAAVGGDIAVGSRIGWIDLDGPARIDLAPRETREVEATVDLAGFRRAGTARILFVLEVLGGGNVVPRAATVVALQDGGAAIPAPVGWLLLATGLLVTVAAAWVRVARQQRSDAAAPDDAPVQAEPVQAEPVQAEPVQAEPARASSPRASAKASSAAASATS